jgi:hypothetical protein
MKIAELPFESAVSLIASAARLSARGLVCGPSREDPWLSVLPSRAVWLYRRCVALTKTFSPTSSLYT